jgi:hypothetical protein
MGTNGRCDGRIDSPPGASLSGESFPHFVSPRSERRGRHGEREIEIEREREREREREWEMREEVRSSSGAVAETPMAVARSSSPPQTPVARYGGGRASGPLYFWF